MVQIMKETANVLEYKIGNNANIATFVCLRKNPYAQLNDCATFCKPQRHCFTLNEASTKNRGDFCTKTFDGVVKKWLRIHQTYLKCLT